MISRFSFWDLYRKIKTRNLENCFKNVRIWSYPVPHFPAFGLNMERYSVSLRMQSECRKIRTGITPNTDTFYAVQNSTKTVIILKYNFKNIWNGQTKPVSQEFSHIANHENGGCLLTLLKLLNLLNRVLFCFDSCDIKILIQIRGFRIFALGLIPINENLENRVSSTETL